jgi:hypothetical protein
MTHDQVFEQPVLKKCEQVKAKVATNWPTKK